MTGLGRYQTKAEIIAASRRLLGALAKLDEASQSGRYFFAVQPSVQSTGIKVRPLAA